MRIMKVLKWTLPVSMFAALFVLSTVRAADDAKSSEKVKVSGVVLLEDGKPAANASVRIVPPAPKKSADGAAEKPANQQADGKKPDRPEPIAETKTDADGKFSLEAPAGKYRIMANLRGSGSATKTIDLKHGKDMENVELKLKPRTPKTEKPAAQ
jgi:hypothetical protein